MDGGFALENCITSAVRQLTIPEVPLETREDHAALPVTFNVCVGFLIY